MRRNALTLFLLPVLALLAASLSAETRPEPGTNPIRLEGQIREIGADGDHVVIRLHRDSTRCS